MLVQDVLMEKVLFFCVVRSCLCLVNVGIRDCLIAYNEDVVVGCGWQEIAPLPSPHSIPAVLLR